MRRIIAVPRERVKILLNQTSLARWPWASLRAAGMIRDVDATTMRDAIVDAAVALNW
jgi:hypothetical protein